MHDFKKNDWEVATDFHHESERRRLLLQQMYAMLHKIGVNLGKVPEIPVELYFLQKSRYSPDQ